MLDIYLVHNPDIWNRQPLDGERGTDERLEYQEWEAIFFTELMGFCPYVSRSEMLEAENRGLRRDLYQQRFQEAIPEYPLLGRMWDMYVDAFYKPEEVDSLLQECLKVKAKTKNTLALKGLDKLICGCIEASESKLALYLACD